MYTSINAVLEKIERQALKHKGKKIDKKRKSATTAQAALRELKRHLRTPSSSSHTLQFVCCQANDG